MQWEEFTQFIIDTVEGDKDAKVNEGEDEKNSRLFDEKAMQKYKRYMVSEKIKDNLTHKNYVTNEVFLNKLDIIIISEYGAKNLKIYNAKTGKSTLTLEIDDLIDSNSKKISKLDRLLAEKLSVPKNQKGAGPGGVKNGYSVLFLTYHQDIVALCLSDKRILFFYFLTLERIELIYEMKLPVLEQRIWYLPAHKIWVSSGCKLDKYNYFTLNELDIDIKIKNQKFECKATKGHPFRRSFCEVMPHKGEILDVIEIIRPKKILTASLDGKIRLLDINDKDIVKVWSEHTLGVRSLHYNPLIDIAGYILSVGFEYFINVYCPDLSVEEAFKGKLEGHNAPVVTCKFLGESYMAVSVDEEGNVRIWDTKLRLCLQTIETPKKNFMVSGILRMTKYNRFSVYGNKVIYYDAKYREEDNSKSTDAEEENYPFKIEYNKYYQQFFIATFRDVRVYNHDGNLYKIYKKLTTNEHFESEVKIRSFLLDDHYRKFYLGFSNGAIMQFNAGNGSLI
jgi:WD40 repeat protein